MKQLIILLTIGFLAGCSEARLKKTGKEGKPLPSFTVRLMDSSLIDTRKLSIKEPVALFFLSPICPYCRAQTKAIIENMDDLKNIQFIFVTSFPLSDLKKFYAEYHLSKYPNIISAVDTGNFIPNYFEITGVPYIAIYGKDKKLSKAFQGKIYSSQIKKAANS